MDSMVLLEVRQGHQVVLGAAVVRVLHPQEGLEQAGKDLQEEMVQVLELLREAVAVVHLLWATTHQVG